MKAKIIEQDFMVLTELTDWRGYEIFLFQVEEYGRVCYKSEKTITTETATAFVQRLIKSGHESVLEHCNLTIKFIIDRAIANALVRHRHCAFSQESTHFIDYLKKGELIFIRQIGFPKEDFFEEVNEIAKVYGTYDKIKTSARRSLLPLCLKTELVMTTNLREWRHILKIRTEKNCHPQMRILMLSVLDWFKIELPIFVEDI